MHTNKSSFKLESSNVDTMLNNTELKTFRSVDLDYEWEQFRKLISAARN